MGGFSVTVMVMVSKYFSFALDLTVMTALPTAIPLTFPVELTLATLGSEELQTTLRSVVFVGVYATSNPYESPTCTEFFFVEMAMPLTAISFTVTVSVWERAGFSSEVTVMTIVPAFFAATVPSACTSAIALSEDWYSNDLFVASAGETVHLSFPFCPASKVGSLGESVCPERTMPSMVNSLTSTRSASGFCISVTIPSIASPTEPLRSEDWVPGVIACIQSTKIMAR